MIVIKETSLEPVVESTSGVDKLDGKSEEPKSDPKERDDKNEESKDRPEVVVLIEPNSKTSDVITLEESKAEAFHFVCAVCGKGLNSTQNAISNHIENHGHTISVITLMKEIRQLKSIWLSKFECQLQENSILKRDLEEMKLIRTPQTRELTSTPPPQRLPPAPASPPYPTPLASSPQLEAPSTSSSSQQKSATYGQMAGRTSPTPSQEQPPTFRPAPRPKGGGREGHLLLADSITRALVYPKLEAPSGSLIKQVNTYSSQYDERAHKPHRNVNQVIREELRKKEYSTVFLGAPSVDITNQDVSEGILDENVAETISSSLGMVEAAEYAISSGRAKKVVILQHIPRYDIPKYDPHGVRPQLAQLANSHLQRARDASDFAEHILVGEHSGLECEGDTRTNRFTNDQTHIRNWGVKLGKYDGVHLYSQEGAEALTKSMLAIMKRAGMVRRPVQVGLPSRPAPRAQGQWSNPSRTRGFRGNPSPQAKGPREYQVPVWNRYQNFQ